jgi:hypothetical protein
MNSNPGNNPTTDDKNVEDDPSQQHSCVEAGCTPSADHIECLTVIIEQAEAEREGRLIPDSNPIWKTKARPATQ